MNIVTSVLPLREELFNLGRAPSTLNPSLHSFVGVDGGPRGRFSSIVDLSSNSPPFMHSSFMGAENGRYDSDGDIEMDDLEDGDVMMEDVENRVFDSDGDDVMGDVVQAKDLSLGPVPMDVEEEEEELEQMNRIFRRSPRLWNMPRVDYRNYF